MQTPSETGKDANNTPEMAAQLPAKNDSLRNFLNSLSDWIWEVDQSGTISFSNSAVENMLGYTQDNLIGKSMLSLFPTKENQAALDLLEKPWGLGGSTDYIQHSLTGRQGHKVYFETNGSPFYDHVNKRQGLRFISRLIDQNDEKTISSFLMNEITEAVLLMDQDRIISFVNNGFSKIFGYDKKEIIGRSITELGAQDSVAESLSMQPEDVTELLDQEDPVWQGEVLRKAKNGRYIPCHLSARVLRNPGGEVSGYMGVYMDMRRLKKADLIEKKALKATINALCKSIDTRNVLKGQHQEQVTDLAVEIAVEMGKDVSFIEGLTLASHLHDLGEMYIPPDIASKEGKLSESDFEMIKIHPIKGYEILKEIDFPWPVAEIVLQHHERLDGSGYPNHLKGDEIRLEARILAVADVIATMLTDRPYRPACSLEQCVDELEINRGTRYDEKVVEICLRLLRERNYQLKPSRI